MKYSIIGFAFVLSLVHAVQEVRVKAKLPDIEPGKQKEIPCVRLEDKKPNERVGLELPNAVILTHRFEKKCLHHFIEKTKIVGQLAGKTLKIDEVIQIIKKAFKEYENYMDEPYKGFMEGSEPDILLVLYKDYLKLEGLKKPEKKNSAIKSKL